MGQWDIMGYNGIQVDGVDTYQFMGCDTLKYMTMKDSTSPEVIINQTRFLTLLTWLHQHGIQNIDKHSMTPPWEPQHDWSLLVLTLQFWNKDVTLGGAKVHGSLSAG